MDKDKQTLSLIINLTKEATVCRIPASWNDCGIHTFLGQVELFELGSFLVELSLQLLLEFDELRPLLLQSGHSLLEHLWMTERKNKTTANRAVINQLLITES